MKKCGFTLIELLAVIIILAIIAVIATPIILNVIDDARKSAGLSESEMIMSGINNYCATSAMRAQLDGSIDICTDEDGVTIDEVSKMVNLGNAKVEKVTYINGKVTELVIESNNNKYELQPDGIFSVDGEIQTPEEPGNPEVVTPEISYVDENGVNNKVDGLIFEMTDPEGFLVYKSVNNIGGNVTINSGTISEAISTSYKGVTAIDGGSINGIIETTEGSLTISGGDINAKITASNGSNIVISGGNIVGNHQVVKNSTLTILGGNFIFGDSGKIFDVDSTSTVIIKGGIFDVDVSQYLDEGHRLITTVDGLYIVENMDNI